MIKRTYRTVSHLVGLSSGEFLCATCQTGLAWASVVTRAIGQGGAELIIYYQYLTFCTSDVLTILDIIFSFSCWPIQNSINLAAGPRPASTSELRKIGTSNSGGFELLQCTHSKWDELLHEPNISFADFNLSTYFNYLSSIFYYLYVRCIKRATYVLT